VLWILASLLHGIMAKSQSMVGHSMFRDYFVIEASTAFGQSITKIYAKNQSLFSAVASATPMPLNLLFWSSFNDGPASKLLSFHFDQSISTSIHEPRVQC